MATATVRKRRRRASAARAIDVIKATPELTRFTFRAAMAWGDGTHSSARIASFVHARVKARGASEDELKELCSFVQETSPIRDVLANGVPVTTSIEVLA